jgi:hypothetical protein
VGQPTARGSLIKTAEFAVAARQAASAKTAGIVTASTARQIISVVRHQAANHSAAVAVALAVVADALRLVALYALGRRPIVVRSNPHLL